MSVLPDAARVMAVLALPEGYETGLEDYCRHDIENARQAALMRLLQAGRLALGWLLGDPPSQLVVTHRARILGWVISRNGETLDKWDAVPYGQEHPVGAAVTARGAAAMLVEAAKPPEQQ